MKNQFTHVRQSFSEGVMFDTRIFCLLLAGILVLLPCLVSGMADRTRTKEKISGNAGTECEKSAALSTDSIKSAALDDFSATVEKCKKTAEGYILYKLSAKKGKEEFSMFFEGNTILEKCLAVSEGGKGDIQLIVYTRFPCSTGCDYTILFNFNDNKCERIDYHEGEWLHYSKEHGFYEKQLHVEQDNATGSIKRSFTTVKYRLVREKGLKMKKVDEGPGK